MTTYNWSTLTNNQIVPFVPGADLIHFDDPTISAADLGWTFGDTGSPTDPNGNFTLNVGGKTVKFGITITTPAPFASITTNNVTFGNGSSFIVGDNLTSLANDNLPNTLTGGNGNDALFGLGGNDTMTGGLGNDDFWVAFSTGGIGNDSINGGDGFDSLIYNTSSTTATTVNLSGAFNVIAAHTATNAQGTATLISIETVFGTAGVDTFIGGDPAHGIDSLGNRISERFRGNSGNDNITGGSGVNFFTTADYANNTSSQAISASLLVGTASDGRGFTDTLVNIDALRGGDGNDTLTGGSQSRGTAGTFFELFRGNVGNDRLDGNNANSDGIYASTDRADYSNNTSSQAANINLATGIGLDGLGGTDTLIDIDEVYAGAGNDTLTGGAGRDALDGGIGNDILDGGAELDAAHFVQSTAGVIVNLSASLLTVGAVNVAAGTANDGMGGTDTLINIEAVRASDFADYIRGSDLAHREVFRGDAGNDTIDGGGGTEDFVSYSDVPAVLGALNATLVNGAATIIDRKGGMDTLTNIEGLGGTHGNDILTGGAGNQWFSGNGGSDLIDGGIGSDWVTYFGAPSGVTVNLATGTAIDGYNGATNKLMLGGTDTLSNIENAEGSDFNDIITGSSGDNILRGRAGNDVLTGGLGSDTADYTNATSGVSVQLFNSSASNDGQGGADSLNSIENVIGSAFNDVLSGYIDNNLLRGAAGNDTIAGGLGTDTAVFSGLASAYTITRSGLTTTVSGLDGVDTLTGIEFLQFADITKPNRTAWGIDPSGDGKSDVLWRNSTGEVALWLMDGLTPTAQTVFGSVPVSMNIVDGNGDFTGDGKSDILWRDSNGDVTMWLMNGITPTAQTLIGSVPNTWTLVDGHGDYNGDGKDDLLWRNSNGDTALWLMNGTAFLGQAVFGSIPTSWSLIDGSGDYNGDGKGDLLWRNSSGDTALWLMNGLTPIGQAVFGSVPITWNIVDGHGDYNGDGNSDLLWRNSTGDVALWLMNGLTPIGQAVFGSVPTTWSIVEGHGDYNGDGNSDVLWRNSNGDVALWLMNGVTPIGQAVFASVPNTWTIVDGHSDYNGDGKDDLLWRNSNGDVAQWLMSGLTPIGQAVFASVPTTWSITTELGGLLSGDGAADTLTGTTARDTLVGNGGADTLAGGSGADTFAYNATTDSTVASSDRITDFAHGIDKIDLTLIDANTISAGDQAFLFGGNNANTVANSVTWSEGGGNTTLRIDNTGDTTADMQVVLTGIGLGLTATDFVL